MKTRKQAQLEKIQTGYQTGKTLVELGAELKISHTRVQQLAAEIGLKFSDRMKLSQGQKDAIVAMWNEGFTKVQISKNLGIHYDKFISLLPAGLNPKTKASHGTCSLYRGGCRCDLCRKANTEYFREFRARNKKASR